MGIYASRPWLCLASWLYLLLLFSFLFFVGSGGFRLFCLFCFWEDLCVFSVGVLIYIYIIFKFYLWRGWFGFCVCHTFVVHFYLCYYILAGSQLQEVERIRIPPPVPEQNVFVDDLSFPYQKLSTFVVPTQPKRFERVAIENFPFLRLSSLAFEAAVLDYGLVVLVVAEDSEKIVPEVMFDDDRFRKGDNYELTRFDVQT